MGDRGERARSRTREQRRSRARAIRRDQTAPDISVRVRRRQILDRAGHAQRPRDADVPPRDRCGEGCTQSRCALRPARVGAGVARGLHRDSISVRQARFHPDSVLPVRRHGACGRDSLQRDGPDARRERDAEPAAQSREHDRARDRAHVVRRSRDHAVVQRRLDERGLCQLHGGEDRQPVVPGRESRAALPAVELSGCVLGGSHGGRESDSAAAQQSQRCGAAVRAHHLREGADRHAAARDGGRRAAVPRRPSRVSEEVRVRQRDMARPHSHPRRKDAGEPRGVEPCVGRRTRQARVHHDAARREGRHDSAIDDHDERSAAPPARMAAADARDARVSGSAEGSRGVCERARDGRARCGGIAQAALHPAERRGARLRTLSAR